MCTSAVGDMKVDYPWSPEIAWAFWRMSAADAPEWTVWKAWWATR